MKAAGAAAAAGTPGRFEAPVSGAIEVRIPQLLTVPEAAQALTVSKVTIRTWVRERKLRKVKLGRRVAITAESVAALIDRGLT